MLLLRNPVSMSRLSPLPLLFCDNICRALRFTEDPRALGSMLVSAPKNCGTVTSPPVLSPRKKINAWHAELLAAVIMLKDTAVIKSVSYLTSASINIQRFLGRLNISYIIHIKNYHRVFQTRPIKNQTIKQSMMCGTNAHLYILLRKWCLAHVITCSWIKVCRPIVSWCWAFVFFYNRYFYKEFLACKFCMRRLKLWPGYCLIFRFWQYNLTCFM